MNADERGSDLRSSAFICGPVQMERTTLESYDYFLSFPTTDLAVVPDVFSMCVKPDSSCLESFNSLKSLG